MIRAVWILETTRKRGENAMIETPTYNRLIVKLRQYIGTNNGASPAQITVNPKIWRALMREVGAALYHSDDKAIWLGQRGTSDGVRVVRNRQDVDILFLG
jgi:hypothetical protein